MKPERVKVTDAIKEFRVTTTKKRFQVYLGSCEVLSKVNFSTIIAATLSSAIAKGALDHPIWTETLQQAFNNSTTSL